MSTPAFKVIALDMDGTLLTSEHRISPATREALQQARDQGTEVILVTGRHFMTARPYHHELQLTTPMVCGNGAYLYDPHKNAITHGDPLPTARLPDLFAQMRRQQVQALMHLEQGIVYQQEGKHVDHLQAWTAQLPAPLKPQLIRARDFEPLAAQAEAVWKLELFHEDAQALAGFIDRIAQPFGLSCEWSSPWTVDLVQAGNSKGNRLAQWVAEQGHRMDDVIAFGDNFNDISMFHRVGFGVAMGNAAPEIRQQAHQVTDSHDEDGIANALRRWVL